MNWNAKWIKSSVDFGEVCPVFSVKFDCSTKICKAVLSITALGVYEAELNGQRVGKFIMAPGWTMYEKRLQVQQYDVSNLLTEKGETNILAVTVGTGWYKGRVTGLKRMQARKFVGLTAMLELFYEDGSSYTVSTDDTWKVSESKVRLSEIYGGEIYDASFVAERDFPVEVFEGPTETLIPQQGEEVREQEHLNVADVFKTPKGELVFDFGQEITGYIELQLDAVAGEKVSLSFAEVMDKEGNFYTENYRKAKALYVYTCKDGRQIYKPKLTFYGFRYIRINEFPGGVDKAMPENFTAVVVHSQMKRTGYINSSNPLLNRLFDNVIWGQKGNFLDIPTDCPQRDERYGWTGDAQVFIRTACLNFDTEKFFEKWLADMAAGQEEDGKIGRVVPNVYNDVYASAAWEDAATICPWTLYLAYGNPRILQAQYDCMEKWVNHITNSTTTKYLWTGGKHFGDWLGLDAPSGSYKGSTRDDFIASAFYAYSTELLIKSGKVLGKNMTEYETLYENIIKAFRSTYQTYETQTECVLAAYFKLAEYPQMAADQLAEMVKSCGSQLQTGFVGTPYLLHVLSDYGYVELAYDLLLRTKYPSWLYPVTKGATTIWEHWDGIMENGDFWSADMNSFNHYAYGAVADWIYCQAAGIQNVEESPGYEKVRIAPLPDERLDWLQASVDTRHGKISSRWCKQDSVWRYEITTPMDAEIVIDGRRYRVAGGEYIFYSKLKKNS